MKVTLKTPSKPGRHQGFLHKRQRREGPLHRQLQAWNEMIYKGWGHSMYLSTCLIMSGWWLTMVDLPLWKIWTSVGIMTFPIYEKIKHVPNHQPDVMSGLSPCAHFKGGGIFHFGGGTFEGRKQKSFEGLLGQHLPGKVLSNAPQNRHAVSLCSVEMYIYIYIYVCVYV